MKWLKVQTHCHHFINVTTYASNINMKCRQPIKKWRANITWFLSNRLSDCYQLLAEDYDLPKTSWIALLHWATPTTSSTIITHCTQPGYHQHDAMLAIKFRNTWTHVQGRWKRGGIFLCCDPFPPVCFFLRSQEALTLTCSSSTADDWNFLILSNTEWSAQPPSEPCLWG